MAYPGNPELSPQAQDRVMTAFRQVVGKLQQGNRQEAQIGLEFVLRLDPAYAPAHNLQAQLGSGAVEIDINAILGELQAPTTDAIDSLLAEAVEDFNEHDFEAAKRKVEQVLLDLPGHQDARQLLREIEAADKGDSQVRKFLAQAEGALARGDSQEAANFVMMAQALDPHHAGIAATIANIQRGGEVSLEQAGFASTDELPAGPDFSAAGDGEPLFGAAEEAAAMFADAAAKEPPRERAAAPGAGAPAIPAAPLGAAGEDGVATYYSSSAIDDVSELFQEAPEIAAGQAGGGDRSAATIRDLLARGGAAAAEDDYAAAIDSWSRILLIDPEHEEARDRIEHIRHAKEELERRIEPMLADAQEAHEAGNPAVAKDFVNRILALSPRHVEASRLADLLGAPAAPASSARAAAASGMPELEDDLFSEEFSATPDFGAEVEQRQTTLEGEWRTPKKPKRRLPWQWWAMIGVGGLAIVAFSLWVASSLMPDKAPPESRVSVVNRVLTEAAELYNTGRVQEAILLLEQNSADDVFQKRIDTRLEEYRRRVATPVPTPVPEGLAACRALLAEGRWMAAYIRAKDELRLHPNDPGLEEIRGQILEVEPAAAALWDARASGDYRAAVAITRDLLAKRPGEAEIVDVYERSLFNAGMSELKAFNLAEADGFIAELIRRRPEDEEARRVREFITTYKSRPIDMQLEIFVGSIPPR